MTTFKAMTWNVENLFRAGLAPEERERHQRKIGLLAGVISQSDPDVVALQEVGGLEPLQDLQQRLGDSYPHRSISNFPDGRGIRVAFLSKLSIDNEDDMVDFAPGPATDIHGLDVEGNTPPITRMGRGALRIRVRKDGGTVDLITAHLKSKLLVFPSGRFFTSDDDERAHVGGIALMRRMAEAVTLRIRVNEFLKGNADNRLLLLGDFNDVTEAQTSLILNGPSSSEIGTGGFNRPDRGDDVRLFNLAPLIPEERRFSRKHRGRGELIDFILASEEFFPRDENNDRRLPEVDSLVDFADQLPSVGDDPSERVGDIKPDHAPGTALFDHL